MCDSRAIKAINTNRKNDTVGKFTICALINFKMIPKKVTLDLLGWSLHFRWVHQVVLHLFSMAHSSYPRLPVPASPLLSSSFYTTAFILPLTLVFNNVSKPSVPFILHSHGYVLLVVKLYTLFQQRLTRWSCITFSNSWARHLNDGEQQTSTRNDAPLQTPSHMVPCVRAKGRPAVCKDVQRISPKTYAIKARFPVQYTVCFFMMQVLCMEMFEYVCVQ